MARQKGTVKFTGSIGDVTGVKIGDEYYIRQKSNLDGERIQNDPAFANTRKSNIEFTEYTKCTALIEHAFADAILNIKEGRAHNRLGSIVNKIKNLDIIHQKPYRQVATGIQLDAGKELLSGFDFNMYSHLNTVLDKKFDLDTTNGILTVEDLITAKDLQKPKAANKVGIQLFCSKIDFESRTFATVNSIESRINIEDSVQNISLTIDLPPAENSVNVFLLTLVYYQTINGIDYFLNDRQYRCAKIIGVE
ncbi:MAG TPA: hypothetical protein VK590_04650 [Saprospiraceae bacterium]|nr:hypothetical protein [Saprospiraceae bacterium]